MGTLLLTSTGFSYNPAISAWLMGRVEDPARSPVAILTTAAEHKEANEYAVLARRQLTDLGFPQVDFVDVERDPVQKLLDYRILYVCGGNTYYLLDRLRRSGADQVIKDFLGGEASIYIGVSAGSLVAGASIASTGDENTVGLEDLRGLALVPFLVVAHMGPRKEATVARLLAEGQNEVRTIADGELILYDLPADPAVLGSAACLSSTPKIFTNPSDPSGS